MKQDRRALALAGVLSLTLAAAAQAAPDRISIPGEHTFPESITSTSDGALYIGSLGDGVVLRVPPGSATAEPFLPKADGGMSVLGVLADEGSGTLWVCHSDLAVFGETGGKAATLQAYDLRSGSHKASYPFPGGTGFCNDLVVAADGGLFVTDTLNPRILRLDKGAKSLSVWLENPVFGKGGPHLDGIAFGGDGSLYVDTYQERAKLFRVGVTPGGGPGEVKEMGTSRPLSYADAIRQLNGDTLLMIEGAGRLDRVTIDGDKAEVTPLKDGFKLPVSVTVVGRTAWVLEGQLNYLFDPAMKGKKPAPFEALAVPLP